MCVYGHLLRISVPLICNEPWQRVARIPNATRFLLCFRVLIMGNTIRIYNLIAWKSIKDLLNDSI